MPNFSDGNSIPAALYDIIPRLRTRLSETTGISPHAIYLSVYPERLKAPETTAFIINIDQISPIGTTYTAGGPYGQLYLLRGNVTVRTEKVLDVVGGDIYGLYDIAIGHYEMVEKVFASIHYFWPFIRMSSPNGDLNVPITACPFHAEKISDTERPGKTDKLYLINAISFWVQYNPRMFDLFDQTTLNAFLEKPDVVIHWAKATLPL
ncbi:MAG: hypothetical protein QXO37_07065 [Candidatus Nitrosocaldaceae archaeon]|jgi:hypothetical protein